MSSKSADSTVDVIDSTTSNSSPNQSGPVTPPDITNPISSEQNPNSGRRASKINHSPAEIPSPVIVKEEVLCKPRQHGGPSPDPLHPLHTDRAGMHPFENYSPIGSAAGSEHNNPFEQSLPVGDEPTIAEVGGKVLVGTGGPASGQFPVRHPSQSSRSSGSRSRESL